MIKPGSKYHPLFEHLQRLNQAQVSLTFVDIEALLGSDLPSSARQHENWWSNHHTPKALQAHAWVDAGYHVAAVDLLQQTVQFYKLQIKSKIPSKDGQIVWQKDAVKALRKHMNMTQAQLAEELGVRRQTISEWENGVYEPDRSTAKFLALIARQANFQEPPQQD